MTCANAMLSVAAIVIGVVTIWQNIFSAMVNQWIIVVAVVLILLVSWTSVDCKFCKSMSQTKRKR